MRKWMSNRLKGRKKAPKSPSEQAKAPEPLQPKYFESDVSAQTEAEAPRPVELVPVEAQPEAEADVREDVPLLASVGDDGNGDAGKDDSGRPTRRRRRRGGRVAPRRPVNAKAAPSDSVMDAPALAAVEAPLTPDIVAQNPADIASLAVEPPSADTVAAELPPTVAAPVAPRPSKGTVVLAIGLPGSGKSSWFKRHNIRPLASDLLRELLFDDAEEQRFQDLVFSNLRSMLKARLIARRPVSYVDATNLTPHDRHSWIKLAKDYGYEVQGLFFDVPLEICMERHARRGRVVPEDIMRKMSAKLKAPTFEEGFSKIIVVRVKKREQETQPASPSSAAAIP